MPRLTIQVDPDDFRILQQRAADNRRDVRDQASHELEQALVGGFKPGAPPDVTSAGKSGAPGEACKPPGAPRKGTQ